MTIDDLNIHFVLNCYTVTLKSGGKTPAELSGMFSGRKNIKEALDKYNVRINKPKRPKKVKLTPGGRRNATVSTD